MGRLDLPDVEADTAAASSGPHVRALNDAFRLSFSGGRIMITRGIATLPEEQRREATTAVHGFDAFDTDNDPHGEHDFGAFSLGDRRCFCKIDTYDRQGVGHSPNAADSTVTLRVLTVMLADEY